MRHGVGLDGSNILYIYAWKKKLFLSTGSNDSPQRYQMIWVIILLTDHVTGLCYYSSGFWSYCYARGGGHRVVSKIFINASRKFSSWISKKNHQVRYAKDYHKTHIISIPFHYKSILLYILLNHRLFIKKKKKLYTSLYFIVGICRLSENNLKIICSMWQFRNAWNNTRSIVKHVSRYWLESYCSYTHYHLSVARRMLAMCRKPIDIFLSNDIDKVAPRVVLLPIHTV